ncbi:hypothetical protein PATSB16_21620 [Pandoraea thiooxydans]|nr:hypothetical protein PATSB16_21620 [Pandoraea thiooxydans]
MDQTHGKSYRRKSELYRNRPFSAWPAVRIFASRRQPARLAG